MKPGDDVDVEADLLERVRWLETHQPARTQRVGWTPPDNTDLDILTQMVAMLGAWDTIDGADTSFLGVPVGYTAQQLVQKLYSDEGGAWTNYGQYWWGLLLDVDAYSSMGFFDRMEPHPFDGDVYGDRYGDPSTPQPMTPWCQGAATFSGKLKRERMLYFGNLPEPTPVNYTHWQYVPSYDPAANRGFGVAKGGCPDTPIPSTGSDHAHYGYTTFFDTGFPFRAIVYAAGYPQGAWFAYHNDSSNGGLYFAGYNGYYLDFIGGAHSCSSGEETGGYPPAGSVPGAPLGPWLGAEVCPNNPIGHFTQGCSGVYVEARFLPFTDCWPVMAPVPIAIDPSDGVTGPSIFGNVRQGFTIIPEISWPGFDVMKARIAQYLVHWQPVVDWIDSQLGRIETETISGYDMPQWAPLRFDGDDRWQTCRVFAPWIGDVQCRVVGRHVYMRGYVITHGNPSNVDPLVLLPHGLPAPGTGAFAAERPSFLAGAGRHPGPLLPSWAVGGQDFTKPASDIGSKRVALEVLMRSHTGSDREPGSKWYFQHKNEGGSYQLGISQGVHTISFDGIHWIGQDDVVT